MAERHQCWLARQAVVPLELGAHPKSIEWVSIPARSLVHLLCWAAELHLSGKETAVGPPDNEKKNVCWQFPYVL